MRTLTLRAISLALLLLAGAWGFQAAQPGAAADDTLTASTGTVAAEATSASRGEVARPYMTRGSVELVSAGPLTFAPDGTLFLGDTYGAAVFAVDLEEEPRASTEAINLENINGRVAALLGADREDVRVHDLAISPVSRAVYVTASRIGENDGNYMIRNTALPGPTPHLVRVSPEGAVSEVSLEGVLFQKASISDVRSEEIDRGRDRRSWSILELSFVDETLYVSGMSNGEWSAKLRRLPFPFDGHVETNAIRIFHTAHGRYETYAPARVFAPYTHEGETRIFAGFSCTPLVDFSVAEMNERERVEGKTIAELGAGNHVLDMIAVEREGQTHFLLANHLHPFMRLSRADFDGADALTRPSGRAGIDRTPLRSMDGVVRLDSDRDERVVFLQEDGEAVHLRTVSMADLLD